MEIQIKDCTTEDAMEELKFHQRQGYNAFLSGKGNGDVVIVVEGK